MKRAAWIVLVLSAPVFAQSQPDTNLAARNLEKRLDSLKLYPAPRPLLRATAPKLAVLSAPRPCAIPLLNATRPGTADPMRTVQPAAPEAFPRDILPVPACPR